MRRTPKLVASRLRVRPPLDQRGLGSWTACQTFPGSGENMPRVTVTVDPGDGQDGHAPVLPDDQNQGAHLGGKDSPVHVLERLAGTTEDGARLEHVESVTSYLEVDRC